MDVKEKLAEIRKLLGLNEKELAEQAGLYASTLNRTGNPTFDILSKLLTAHSSINANWLFTGKGLPLQSDEDYTIPVPLLSVKASAGFIARFDDEKELKEVYRLSPAIFNSDKKERYCVIEIAGESMYPTIKNGDKVLAKRVDSVEYLTGGVFAVIFGDQFVVKRVKSNKVVNGEITLFSDNHDLGSDVTIKIDEIRGMWKVIKVIESLVS